MLSKIEELSRRVFNYYLPNEEVIYNWRPDFLKNEETGRNLELDIYYPKLNIAIEVNGIHHLLYKNWQRDIFKKKQCKKEKIKLICIYIPQTLLKLNKKYKSIFKGNISYSLKNEIISYSKKKSNKYGYVKHKLEKEYKTRKYLKAQDEERIANLKRFLSQRKITQKEYDNKISLLKIR
jgi:hypothetical protein